MGVLNVTPDSFSDGGRHVSAEAAIRYGLHMAANGADIIDIGGESSRPGSDPVSADEELERVIPVIRGLATACTEAVISIDTTKAVVAEAALEAGAHVVNDISAFVFDPCMVDVARRFNAGVVLMHMQGEPKTMQESPQYHDVVGEVSSWLRRRVDALVATGIPVDNIVVDPGIGFGKSVDHNVELLRGLTEIASACARPVLVGVSRKRFIGAITGRDVEDRLAGSLAAMVFAITHGAQIIRVHDVKESCDVARMIDKLTSVKGDC